MSAALASNDAHGITEYWWNRLAAQLIVNNNAKIAVVNTAEFEAFSEEVRAGLIKHMEKYTNSEAIFVLYGSNTNLYVLGPKSTFNSHLVVVANKHVWNPAGLAKFQLQAMIDPTGLIDKIPRPPNAFLLYRKDKQNSLKADYPNMHNNEISIITGSMWKEERPEVRAKYNDRALAIKAHFAELFPAYRYSPRKAYEIKKRAPRSKKLQIFGSARGEAMATGRDPPALTLAEERDFFEVYPHVDAVKVSRHHVGPALAPAAHAAAAQLIDSAHSASIARAIRDAQSVNPPVDDLDMMYMDGGNGSDVEMVAGGLTTTGMAAA